MTFDCFGCNQSRDFDKDFSILIIDVKKNSKRFCKECRSPRNFVPDVYFDGKPEENLADDPNTGKPRVFLSKGQKASYLKERGLMEAGDKVHGAPYSFSQNQNRVVVDSKDEVFKSIKKVREMGRDARRREYLKIVSQRGRFS